MSNGTTDISMTYDSNNNIIYCEFASGTTFNNVKIYPQVQLKTITDDTYEPYTGGQESPNPDYLQPIEVLEGYNILKMTTFTDGSKEQIKNGVTATINDNGTITCKGTATDQAVFYLTKNDLDFTLGDGYFVCNSPSANQRVEFNCSTDGTDKYLNSYGTGNFINAKTSFVFKSAYILIAKGENVDITFKPMFAKGTEVKPYLPYGCIVYKIIRENFFNENKFVKDNFSNIIEVENGYTVDATKTSNIYTVENAKRNTSYIFKGRILSSAAADIHIRFEYTDGTRKYMDGYTTNEPIDKTFKFISDSTKTLHSIIIETYNYGTRKTYTFKDFMLSENDDEYEPYQEQIVPLDLKGNWVGKISDDIKDYLVTDKKKLWLVKNVAKDFLTDTNVNKQIKEYNNLWWVGIKKPSNSKMYNNWERLKLVVNCAFYSEIREKEQSYQTLIGNGEWGIIVNSNETIENIRPKILGGYYYYQLATPEIIELGELPEPIKTFEGVNNIQLLANLDTEIEVVYALDIKKYTDNKLAEISAQII